MKISCSFLFRYLLLVCFMVACSSAYALETKIVVRAKAKDAKFIGSSLGGAYVIIRNKTNGTILAEGKTEGTTGNTEQIMNTQRDRYELLSDNSTSKFTASIDIDEPLFVRIEVYAPFNYRGSQVQASTELWLIPGKHLVGDGVIVEIPGFIVDILSPRTHNYLPLPSVKNKPMEVKANIVMMCGCVISEGGTWDSNDMEVKAIVKKDGKVLKEIIMQLAEVNLFQSSLDISEKGDYELIVYAYNPQSGNTGVGKVNFVVY